MLYQLSYASAAGMERETGIEPATNSLEGCDSTTELLPPSRSQVRASAGKPAATNPFSKTRSTTAPVGLPTVARLRRARPLLARLRWAKVGGEGRTRTFEAA